MHRAGFISETEVFAASHDEKFALYNMADNVEKGSATLQPIVGLCCNRDQETSTEAFRNMALAVF